MENARLLTETREALERQTATAEVLQVINASPGDLTPVFDAMLEKAMLLCGAAFGTLNTYDGVLGHNVAARGVPTAYAAYLAQGPLEPGRGTKHALETGRPFHALDVKAGDAYQRGQAAARAIVDLGGARTILSVPLMKDATSVGYFNIYRQQVRAFSDKQVALLENFAAQAVIAMENARLLGELRDRTADLSARDADNQALIARQAASIEVLKAIAASPDDPQPVFELIVRRACELCNAQAGNLFDHDGTMMHIRFMHGFVPEAEARLRAVYPRPPGLDTLPGRVVLSGQRVHLPDAQADQGLIQQGRGLGARAFLGVPLLREGRVIGVLALARFDPGEYDQSAIELVQSFAAQAVIAMESARLLGELRESLERQTATAEVLQIINANPGDLTPVFEAMLGKAMTLGEADFGLLRSFDGERAHPLASRGLPAAFAATIARRTVAPQGPLLQSLATGAPVQTLDVKELDLYKSGELAPLVDLGGARTVLNVPLVRDQVPVGYFTFYRQEVRAFTDKQIALMQSFASQAVIAMENARLLGELRSALETTQATLRDLKIAQANLIQAEKMASLGQLTAGIAHEIKNPLNFVNNFAALSVDLLEEFKETAAPGLAHLTDDQRADLDDVSAMLTGNLRKIEEHGKRADGIVRAMLEHSRASSGERREVDLNALVDEALNLAYHGARAQDQDFNITLERDYAASLAPIEVNPQDLTRVFLNIFSNGFYAANKRGKTGAEPDFAPTLRVSTTDRGDRVEIRVRDNGTGIPPDIRDKLFQPFFTTKPTGEGTGLGLSITYDIVTKQHGGTIAVDSEPGVFTEFVVTLPRAMFAGPGERA